ADATTWTPRDTTDLAFLIRPPSDQWPVGSVFVIGLSSAYANWLASTESGTGLLSAVSRVSNWPVSGLYQRASMLTRPVAGSVHSDWYPRLPAIPVEASTLPNGSYAADPVSADPVAVNCPT